MKKEVYPHWVIYNILFISFLFLASGCSVLSPYQTTTQCSDSYNGSCQNIEEALSDSILGVKPEKFDQNYIAKQEQFEKNNPELVAERKRLKAMKQAVENGEIDANNDVNFLDEMNAPRTADVSYRENLFNEYKNMLNEPITPMIMPPKPARVLIVDSTAGQDSNIYIPPHYVFFLIERPQWVLKKLPELHKSQKGTF